MKWGFIGFGRIARKFLESLNAVEGEEAYKSAKNLMKQMMPSHAKKIKAYKKLELPLFHAYDVENQLDSIDDISVVHSEEYVYFLDKKNQVLNRLGLDSLVSVSLKSFIQKAAHLQNYILGIDCRNSQLYMVMLDKVEQQNNSFSNYLSVYKIADEGWNLKVEPMMSKLEIPNSDQNEILGLRSVKFFQKNLQIYFDFTQNQGYRRISFDPTAPEKLISKDIPFKVELSKNLQNIHFLAGSDKELVIAEALNNAIYSYIMFRDGKEIGFYQSRKSQRLLKFKAYGNGDQLVALCLDSNEIKNYMSLQTFRINSLGIVKPYLSYGIGVNSVVPAESVGLDSIEAYSTVLSDQIQAQEPALYYKYYTDKPPKKTFSQITKYHQNGELSFKLDNSVKPSKVKLQELSLRIESYDEFVNIALYKFYNPDTSHIRKLFFILIVLIVSSLIIFFTMRKIFKKPKPDDWIRERDSETFNEFKNSDDELVEEVVHINVADEESCCFSNENLGIKNRKGSDGSLQLFG